MAIVAYQAEQFIADCLQSLIVSTGARLRIVVVDNASDDGTAARIREWAQGQAGRIAFAEAAVGEIARAEADVTLLRAASNGGFAWGCNRALEVLLPDPAVNLFWLLNPDCTVPPVTAAAFARAGADGQFALMGGRVIYQHQPDRIQTDGGRVSRRTGVCRSVHADRPVAGTPLAEAAALDFVSGASCVASRRFIEAAGLMREDYFVFYEEVDWAMRRGRLPLRVAPGAVVLHRGGATIGSATHGHSASPFAEYFNHRNRMRFVRRFAPAWLPVALAYGAAKAARLALRGEPGAARAVLAGTLALAPPAAVRARLHPSAWRAAFGAAFRLGGRRGLRGA